MYVFLIGETGWDVLGAIEEEDIASEEGEREETDKEGEVEAIWAFADSFDRAVFLIFVFLGGGKITMAGSAGLDVEVV